MAMRQKKLFKILEGKFDMKMKLLFLLLLTLLLSACCNQSKLVYDNNGCAYVMEANTWNPVKNTDDWTGSIASRIQGSDKPTCNSGVKNVQNN